jgi:hypothetical protein
LDPEPYSVESADPDTDWIWIQAGIWIGIDWEFASGLIPQRPGIRIRNDWDIRIQIRSRGGKNDPPKMKNLPTVQDLFEYRYLMFSLEDCNASFSYSFNSPSLKAKEKHKQNLINDFCFQLKIFFDFGHRSPGSESISGSES